MNKITVIGTGYVGLVTGASLADLGHEVICLDIDREKIEGLREGKIPFFEPGLEELVERGIESGRLQFESSYCVALKEAAYCFLALPTPSSEDDHCDLRFILSAARKLATEMQQEMIIINKSTVPVGTASKVADAISEELDKRYVSIPFEVVSNPEFLREGSAVRDFKEPKRILLGVESEHAEKKMRAIYAPFSDKVVVTDIASSELAKYAANAMLAMRLTMMNTFSGLCEKLGADIEAIRAVLGKDPRIGSQYLKPGVGFGGSCLPKDVRALRAICTDAGQSPGVFDEILKINEEQQAAFFDKITGFFNGVEGKTLAIWGLSFKPDTDDLREAPSLTLCQRLLDSGAILRVFDPAALEKAKAFFDSSDAIVFCESETDAATGSDAIVLMTEWRRFSYLDFESLGALMQSKVLFDGRNQFTDGAPLDAGFDYLPIGKQAKRQVAYS